MRICVCACVCLRERISIDYRRAVTAMAIIGLLVAVTANAFTAYAIRRPRYVLRRLAGCLQLGAGNNTVSMDEVSFLGLGC